MTYLLQVGAAFIQRPSLCFWTHFYVMQLSSVGYVSSVLDVRIIESNRELVCARAKSECNMQSVVTWATQLYLLDLLVFTICPSFF